MFNPSINNVVVTIATKYTKHYSNIMKAANLNPGTQLNPADLVQIVGEIVALPKAISNDKLGYEGFSLKDIEVGDTAIFRFDVVFDLQDQEFSDVPLYKNMIWYQGKEYWMVDIQKLFGVIKAENKSIKMLNSYCMLEDVEEEGRIYLPQAAKRITRAKEATLSQIGNSRTDETRYDIFPGDRVLVHPHRIQNYSIGEKKFSIVAQKDIFGRVL